jgi:DNA (cytosine-5)-methyltransferase 1
MLTFGSLFAGIGGIDLGFERCGMECRWQVEIDPYATKVLEKHWPSVNRWGDVKTFPPDDNEKWKVDVIAGGFPCQDISVAGKGEGLSGKRSGLFFEIIRVARQLKPRAIVLENVPALLVRGMGSVLGELAEIGFDAEWHCIPAAGVGAPHRRDRVFIIAYTKHDGSHGNGKDEQKCEREEMGRSQFAGGDGGDWNVADSDNKQRKGSEQKTLLRQPTLQRKFRRSCKDIRKQWSVEPNVGRVAHGVPNRVDRLKGLGNAVVPQVAEVVGKMLLERLKENEKASP